jgi:cytochrome c556
MQFRHWFLCPALSLLLALGGSASLSAKEHTPLEESMEAMGKSFKTLRAATEKPDPAKKEEYLAAAKSLKEESKKSGELVPAKIEGLPEAEKAAALESYKKQIAKCEEAAAKLEEEIKADKWTEAAETVKEIRKLMGEGHKEFRKKDD